MRSAAKELFSTVTHSGSAVGRRVVPLKAQLLALLGRLKGEGRRMAAYGASAKGSTLMNAFGIDGARSTSWSPDAVLESHSTTCFY